MSSAPPAPGRSGSETSPTPSTPIGVRTYAVVSGRWVAAALLAAFVLAAVVFVMVPMGAPPGRGSSPPDAPSAAKREPPKPAQVAAEPVRPQQPARAEPSGETAAPPPPDNAGQKTVKPEPARTGNRVAAQQFEGLMSRGLGQLERSDWPGAEQSFSAALKLRPDDRSAADGLARAQGAGQRDALTRLQRDAQGFESAERWEEALAAYQRAAAIDPAVDFARHGAARADRMLQLHARIDAFLARPERLYTPRVRDEARELLTAVEREAAAGPRITEARQRLEAAIQRATTPVTVRLASDNATEVTLHRVGPLGRFQDREVALTPGTYTLVGSRPGFKDVRVEVTVDPDTPAPRIYVACEERV